MIETSSIRLKLRQEMPVTTQFSYLDHAAVAPLPTRSAAAIKLFADQATQEGDVRWLDWATAASRTRQYARQLINAQESEIALVANTTQAIGLVAEGLPWKSGDNVVVPVNEFPSNLLPWRNLARLGVELRLAEVGPQGQFDAESLAGYLDSRTRLVSLSWVGFSSGFRCDLEAISQMVHQKGSLLFVDAIQGLGAFPLNVASLPIDFLAADGHKWMLGPEGAGLMYVKQQHLDLLQPLGIGWNSLANAGFDPKSVQLKSTAARYEGGSTNMVGMMAFGQSLSLLLELGCNQPSSGFQTVILENVEELSDLLLQHDFDVCLPEQPENRSGILGIRWAEADAGGESAYLQARKFLLSRQVVTSVRAGRLRAATHAYNTTDDHRRLVDGLVEFRKLAQ
jgi:cysteine desulfurase / selenocysteine lyase